MVHQYFRLYRDLEDKAPRLRRLAPVSVFVHVAAFLTAIGVTYWLNGPVWTLGGGGGGGGGPISVVLADSGGGAPPPPEPEPAPEPPKPEPKPEPKPKETPKPEPKAEPKPNIDPNAVIEAKKPEEQKKEPEKPKEKPEEKKAEPKKAEKPKETKKEEPKPPAEAKKTPVKKKEPVEIVPTNQKNLLAKNTGTKPGPGAAPAGGDGSEGPGGLGPPGISNLPPGLEGWGRGVVQKVSRQWRVPEGLAMAPDNYADVEFTVDRNGNVVGAPRIIREGLAPELGQSGLNAIIAARTFPPFPTNFTGGQITVVYRFNLSL